MTLYLHKEKGVNPRMTFCPRCHNEASEIILLGAREYYSYCPNCKLNTIGSKKCGKCNKTNSAKKIDEYERLPASEPCDECKKQIKEVKKGGIFFKCLDCNAIGAVKNNHPLAKKVREQMNIEPPEPVGIEFDKSTCPGCNKQNTTD